MRDYARKETVIFPDIPKFSPYLFKYRKHELTASEEPTQSGRWSYYDIQESVAILMPRR